MPIHTREELCPSIFIIMIETFITKTTIETILLISKVQIVKKTIINKLRT